jgi:hypothetical protein
MQALWHWLTELGEVYARHADRHGPNRLLPAEVLPTHDCVPGHDRASPGRGASESSRPGCGRMWSMFPSWLNICQHLPGGCVKHTGCITQLQGDREDMRVLTEEAPR